MKTEKVVKEDGVFCDCCGREAPKNGFQEVKEEHYIESKHGDGIYLSVFFRTRYSGVRRSGKTRHTAFANREPSDLCGACREKHLKRFMLIK